MKALDVFRQTMLYSYLRPNRREDMKPGRMIQRLSEESRKVLKKLKSSDIKNVIKEEIYGDDKYYRREEFSKEMIEFDKKMNIRE